MSLGNLYGNAGNSGETRKIFCAYHKTQFLTNFCLEKECLMPLCPSCVAQHTQEHYQSSQKPTYVNLNQALQEVKQKCYAQIITLEEYNKKNDELVKYRENLSQNVRHQLGQCKQEIYVKVEQLFQRYQIKILKHIQQKYQQARLYEIEEANNISQYTNQQIQTLYDKIGVLKSEHCLAALIRFYDHEQQDFEQALKDVNDYLDKHKNTGRAKINLNMQLLNEKLEGMCDELLSLSYSAIQQSSEQNVRNSKVKKGLNNNFSMTTPIRKESYNKLNSSILRPRQNENPSKLSYHY